MKRFRDWMRKMLGRDLGRIAAVTNLGKKPTADCHYYVTACLYKGEKIFLAMTDNEFDRIRDRAMKNSEDIPSWMK